MKRLIFSALVLSAVTANAQVKNGMVGINTDEPRATMHIEPGVSESRGLIIPRITADQMKTMTNLAHFGADHHAIITYLKEQLPAADRTGKLVDVADPGYYYYDNTTGVEKWRTFGGGAEQDLRVVGNNHITQDAGVGGTATSVGTGGGNIALGRGTLNSNTTGWGNIVLGVNALNNNTTGFGNIAQGTLALENNTTGYNNIALGANALMYNSTGTDNIALGNETLIGQNGNLMTGSQNIALGRYSLRGNTTGHRNIAIGQTALKGQGHLQPVEGSSNIAIGSGALSNTTTGSGNIAFGGNALLGNTAGGANIAIGAFAIGAPNVYSQGSQNIGIGNSTLQYLTTGSNNIALGSNALGNISTGYYNIAIGKQALEGMNHTTNPMTGVYNIALGYQALRQNSGDHNTANGYRALENNISGKYNVSLGNQSGDWIKGNGNIHIGNHQLAIPMTGQLNNVVAIGNGVSTNSSNSTDNVILLGKTGLDAPRVGVGTYKPQAKLDVAGAVRVANDTSACTSANEGAIRYNKPTKKFQGCDGTGWVNLN